MIYEFWENDMPEVYSDFIIKQGNEIRAISLIGTEITIKAYRAKFLDSNLARRTMSFFVSAEGERPEIIYKPSEIFANLPAIKTEQGYQVFMYSQNLIFGLTHDELINSLYNHLYELNIPCPTPTEPEYKECLNIILSEAIQCSYFVKCKALGNIPENAQFYIINDVCLSEFREDAATLISQFIFDDIDSEEILEDIEGIADYIEKYSSEIGEKIGNRVSYLHTPGDYDEGKFNKLTRELFPQQKDIVAGTSKRIDIAGNAIVSGQMGTGKTSIGIATCHYHSENKAYRTIVTCPGHLVEKWAREVNIIIPDAKAFIFTGNKKVAPWEQFYTAYKTSPPKPDTPEFWIVSNEVLRGGYITKPGYTIRKKKFYNAEKQEYEFGDICTCPKCGKELIYPVKDDSGDTIWVTLLPSDFLSRNTRNNKCIYCEEVLWQADNNRKGYRKISVADIIKKHIPKNFFTYFIADEAHKCTTRSIVKSYGTMQLA